MMEALAKGKTSSLPAALFPQKPGHENADAAHA